MTNSSTSTTSAQATRQAVHLLGGAQRVRTRPRGFAPWSPEKATLELLDQVRGVLDEYEDYLPLTIRQIYRLVGAHEYEKTERAYDRLGEHLNRARRARLISMDAIRDDTSVVVAPIMWRDAAEWLAAVRDEAKELMLDRTAGQPTRLVVTCEAAGMAPQLGRVANPFGIPAMSGGGFDSVTDKHKFAASLADHDRPTEVLAITDLDASGAHKYLAEMEDALAFARDLGGKVTFTRLAVTREQIKRHRLPTAPPKATDRRAFHGETCQVEALAPDVLSEILRTAIEARVDQRMLARVLRQERRIRRELSKKFAP
jgi:hypothetical protein